MRRAGSCYQHNEFTKVPVVCLGAPRSLAGDSCSITSGGGMDLVAWGNCLGCLNFKLIDTLYTLDPCCWHAVGIITAKRPNEIKYYFYLGGFRLLEPFSKN